jgi:hypothetical protein
MSDSPDHFTCDVCSRILPLNQGCTLDLYVKGDAQPPWAEIWMVCERCLSRLRLRLLVGKTPVSDAAILRTLLRQSFAAIVLN